MQFGAFLGYISFGWMADRFGRRPAFFAYVVTAAILTPIYGLTPRWAGEHSQTWLLVLGPFIGFCGTGFFALFGAMLAELYPTSIRGTGQGFVYNVGRAISALAPFAVGAIADRQGIGAALALNSAFFLLGSVLIFTLPETRNMELT
jgi:MFS family permease